MQDRRSWLGAPDGPGAWLGPALVAVAGLLAYRTLWLGAPAAAYDVDRVLLRPSALPGPLVLGLAGWLLWRRRGQLRALPERHATLLTLALASLGTGLFVWAPLTRTPHLLFVSLAANGLAFAAATRGAAGCRASLVPALVLLFGARLPQPLEDEVVWRLQLWTAEWASRLLDVIGRDFAQGGVILRDAEHTFHVIDSCSGMSGIQILTLTALIVRELFADAGRRQWLLVALAPPLGFALNVVRVAYVAASPDPEALAGIEGDHTTQGLVVLMAGTAILYALGWAMARANAAPGPAPPELPSPKSAGRAPWAIAACGLAVLAVLAWTLPSFSEAEPARRRASIDFPAGGSGWTSERTQPHPLFVGALSSAIHRRYALEDARDSPQFVELLISYEEPTDPGSSRLLSSKLVLPGPEWDLVRSRREQLWQLGGEVDLALVSRGEEHAVVYAWRPRYRGLWRESWRSLLALEASPMRRDGRRATVRLVAYAPHNGQLVLDQAKQRLDRFVRAFREELAAL